MWNVWILLISALILIVRFVRSKQSFWKNAGVPCAKTTFLFGNLYESLIGKRFYGDILTDIYNEFSNSKYVGFYKFLQPSLIVRDVELIKNVMIKDFDHFDANDVDATDDILKRNPFVLSGHEWKVTRALLTPSFTSGKMKAIYPLIDSVADKMVVYLKTRGKNVNGKDLCVKFTTENVAICAFGLDGQAFEEQTSEFVKVAREMGDLSGLVLTKLILISAMPFLSKFLKVQFLSDRGAIYLKSIVRQTLEYREKNKIVRNDFLDSINQLQTTAKEYTFTEEDVVSHAAGFFGDGVETSSIVLSYLLYEFGANQDVQTRTRDEIKRVIAKEGLNYEAYQQMTYFDCVMNENLRKNGPATFLLKRCTKDYQLPPANEGGVSHLLKSGTTLIIPVEGLHKNPDYFAKPEQFDPERFTAGNKEKIQKFTYIPFGEGPRICLGQRFGTLQIKMAAVKLLMNYRIKVNPKTIEPLQSNPSSFMRTPTGGIWLDFEPI